MDDTGALTKNLDPRRTSSLRAQESVLLSVHSLCRLAMSMALC